VLVGDYVYGGAGLNKGDPTCVNFATGEIVWKAKAPSNGSASVLYADCHVWFRYGGGKPGVSDTFASALWRLDYMFLLASYDCEGLNLELPAGSAILVRLL